MITGAEFERRLRRISQMRNVLNEMRRAAAAAHARGEIPWKPEGDPRSDADHWRRQIEAVGLDPAAAPKEQPKP